MLSSRLNFEITKTWQFLQDEMFSYYDSNSVASAKRTQANVHTPLNISPNGPWSDIQIWPYSTVRAF